jgi:hypothetical protein
MTAILPSLRSTLAQIQDDLDSRQIVVQFRVTNSGVAVVAQDYPSLLIARAELRRAGVLLAGEKP